MSFKPRILFNQIRVVPVNEGAKTGIFGAAALAMLTIAFFVSMPPATESSTQSQIGLPLFSGFTDPLAASVLRITTFDEAQGEIAKFEVAKDQQNGVWSLPSRNNYPADAAEQMKNAANTLVGVKILDIPSSEPADHAKYGVMEPNEEALKAGDEGVGRLVSLKGINNSTLAEVIIGNRVKGSEVQRYVRVPGQDPVYVVALDDKALTTKFEDWIEKDLLQLSSIDISNVEVQNYDASLEMGNRLAMTHSYDASLSIDGSNAWKLDSMSVYDEQGEKQELKLAEGEKLATAKLNTLKNSLDDLKIVDVASKPKGMSENLKADKDLVSDQQAVLSLVQRGFFPVTQGDILAANGEMVVTLKDGVQYVLRFGNVEGIADESKDDAAKEGEAKQPEATGSNRYLLVTTRVDESKFPPPELMEIPKTIADLEAADAAKAEAAAPKAPATPAADDATETPQEPTAPAEEMEPESTTETPATEEPAAVDSEPEAPADSAAAVESGTVEENPVDTVSEAVEGAVEGTNEQSGEGKASGSGEGQDQADGEAAAVAEEKSTDTGAIADEPTAADAPTDEKPVADSVAPSTLDIGSPAGDDKVETAEEKQERLEAEQEKITKENQRKLDERKDKLEAASRRVRELNGRFAEWYYVIPEATYRNLRLSREELIEKPTTGAPSAPDDAAAAPSFNIPGLGN